MKDPVKYAQGLVERHGIDEAVRITKIYVQLGAETFSLAASEKVGDTNVPGFGEEIEIYEEQVMEKGKPVVKERVRLNKKMRDTRLAKNNEFWNIAFGYLKNKKALAVAKAYPKNQ
jgi:hypothetical protein